METPGAFCFAAVAGHSGAKPSPGSSGVGSGQLDILNSALSDEGQPQTETAEAVETQQAEQASEQTTGEQDAAPPAETQETREEPQAKGLQAALLAERRRRQELERWIAEVQQKQAQPAAKQETQDGAPDPANYQDNPQQYWRDLARHEARQELKQAEEERRQQQEAEAINRRMAETRDKLNAAVAVGQQKYRDFDAVINGNLAPFLNDAIREEIAASEHGADVAYWLGKNPAEAQRIAGLSERALAREFARLEAKVATPPKPSIPQTLTQARDARGQFANASYDGPTPLDAVLSRKT